LGYDYGTVFRTFGDAGNKIESSYSWGFGLNFPPIGITFLFSNPIRTAPGPDNGTVTHFLLRYLYL